VPQNFEVLSSRFHQSDKYINPLSLPIPPTKNSICFLIPPQRFKKNSRKYFSNYEIAKMGMLAETATVYYRLSFADQGK
jgi:hypothetical protein